MDQVPNKCCLATWLKMEVVQCQADQLITRCQLTLGGWFIVDFCQGGWQVYKGVNPLISVTS